MKRARSELARHGVWFLLVLLIGCGQTVYRYRAYDNVALSEEAREPRPVLHRLRSGHLLVEGRGRVLEIRVDRNWDPECRALTPADEDVDRYLIHLPAPHASSDSSTLENPQAYRVAWRQSHSGTSSLEETRPIRGRVTIIGWSELGVVADLDLQFPNYRLRCHRQAFPLYPPAPELSWEDTEADRRAEHLDRIVREWEAEDDLDAASDTSPASGP